MPSNYHNDTLNFQLVKIFSMVEKIIFYEAEEKSFLNGTNIEKNNSAILRIWPPVEYIVGLLIESDSYCDIYFPFSHTERIHTYFDSFRRKKLFTGRILVNFFSL